ncbi:MAG: hypothetical protein Q9163_001993 [Psora crenata]
MSSNPKDDDFQLKTNSFGSWFKQRPGTRINSKIRIADLRAQGEGRGVAKKDFEKDEVLFTVPLSDVLTVENSGLNSIIREQLSQLQTWDALVLTMIYEDGRGEDSAWWPYLSILPADSDTLVYWSASELAELQGSAVVDKVGKDDADRRFRYDLFPIVQSDPTLFGLHAQAFTGPNAEANFLRISHRMATLILAYSFDLQSDPSSSEDDDQDYGIASNFKKGMVPLADLLNADADLKNAHLVQYQASMAMTTTDIIKAGEQIYNDYGDMPRSNLLRRYGYVTDRYKKWDVVELPLALICETAAKYNPLGEEERDKRVRILCLYMAHIQLLTLVELKLATAWDVLMDGYNLYWHRQDKSVDIGLDLQLTIVALLMDKAKFDEEEVAPFTLWDIDTHPIPTDVYHVLRDVIMQRQRTYATTIAQDAEMLKHNALQKRHRMAVEVRLGEKEILAVGLDNINNWIAERALQDKPEGKHDIEPTKRRKF